MCRLVVYSEIANKNDLKAEISRQIWRKDGEFDIETLLRDVKEIPITIPNCDDDFILESIRSVIKTFISTGHIIVDNGKYTYI